MFAIKSFPLAQQGLTLTAIEFVSFLGQSNGIGGDGSHPLYFRFKNRVVIAKGFSLLKEMIMTEFMQKNCDKRFFIQLSSSLFT